MDQKEEMSPMKAKLVPLKQWRCDVCGQVIERPEDGYVVWKTDADGNDNTFKIIHAGRCDIDRSLHLSQELSSFLGTNGMNELLGFLSRGPLKIMAGERPYASIKDFSGFVNFFRRVQNPYYEEARTKFLMPEVQEQFGDWDEVTPYCEENLKRIIDGF